MRAVSGEEFRQWADAHDIGVDPRYPDSGCLTLLPPSGHARFWVVPADPAAWPHLLTTLLGGLDGWETGLRAVKGRHNLAVMLLNQGRLSEAEGLWRAALTHDPSFFAAQVGLGEVAVKAGNGAALERQASELEGMGEVGSAEAAVLRARWRAARGDHPGAVAILEEAARRLPGSLAVRVALSHAHIAADAPPEVLEPAFRGILALDPSNDQAKRNLEVLYRKTGRWVEVLDGSQPPPAA